MLTLCSRWASNFVVERILVFFYIVAFLFLKEKPTCEIVSGAGINLIIKFNEFLNQFQYRILEKAKPLFHPQNCQLQEAFLGFQFHATFLV